jgi:hypothetical protein
MGWYVRQWREAMHSRRLHSCVRLYTATKYICLDSRSYRLPPTHTNMPGLRESVGAAVLMNILVFQGLGMYGIEDAANRDDLRLKTSREIGAGSALVWGSNHFHQLLPS